MTKNTKNDAAIYSWLQLMDGKDYEACWNLCDDFFKKKVDKSEWVDKLESCSEKLGAIQHRELVRIQEVHDIDGVQKGKYHIYTYKTEYEHDHNIGERITTLVSTDDEEKIIGYYFVDPNEIVLANQDQA